MADAGKIKHPTLLLARYQFDNSMTHFQHMLCLMLALSSRILSEAESVSVLYLMVCSLRVMATATVKVVFCSSEIF